MSKGSGNNNEKNQRKKKVAKTVSGQQERSGIMKIIVTMVKVMWKNLKSLTLIKGLV